VTFNEDDPNRDLVGVEEASRLLGLEPGRIHVMVEEGLLTPVGEGEMRFRRDEVVALRELGG